MRNVYFVVSLLMTCAVIIAFISILVLILHAVTYAFSLSKLDLL